MFKFLLSLLLSTTVFAHSNPFTKDWKMLASIYPASMDKAMAQMQQLDIDVAGVDVKKKIIDVLINDHDYDDLVQIGYEVEILEVKGVTKGPDEEYKNPAEIEAIVTDLYNRYPQLTEKISIGKSLEGRDIWALKISDNPTLDESSEPDILFNSMHHAREVMTPEVGIDIMEYLLDNYGKDSKVTNWVDNNQIWVIPMFNVDGNNMMWNKDKWWRKNTRGGYGVDINRNYPSTWNKCNGSSGDRSSQTYRGASAASEPETQAMMNFVAKIRPVFNISYHSYSEIVIYPLGCNGERTANKDVVEGIGRKLGSKLRYKAGTAWELLYSVDGGDIDWMYEAYQVIPYVIELNSRWQGFHPNYNRWRDKTVKRNRPGWMYLLDRLSQGGIRGNINKTFKSASIDVFNSKKQKIQTYKVTADGVFHIVLNPGNYELQFKVDESILMSKNFQIADKLEIIEVN